MIQLKVFKDNFKKNDSILNNIYQVKEEIQTLYDDRLPSYFYTIGELLEYNKKIFKKKKELRALEDKLKENNDNSV